METTQEKRTMERTEDKVIGRLRILGWSLVAILLLLPAVAMQVTTEVDWSMGDFIFAAVLLIGSGLVCELIVRRSTDNVYRLGALLALAGAFLLTWSNMAVGFIGSGANLANVLYFLLPVIGALGGIVVRFKPKGMAITMQVLAGLQLVITLVAFATSLVQPRETVAVLGINAFFLLLWTGAALLFRRSRKELA